MDQSKYVLDLGMSDEAKKGEDFKAESEENSRRYDEDSEDDGDFIEKPGSVLWEKSFEQNILVEISDDSSFHFSDQQDSFIVCLSQNSAEDSSLNLNDNIEQFDTYEDFQDEEMFSERGSESHSLNHQPICNKSSIRRISEQRQNTMEDGPGRRYSEVGDTSDEDQEDLPYDGDLYNDDRFATLRHNVDINEKQLTPARFNDKQAEQRPVSNACQAARDLNTTPSLASLEFGKTVNKIENYPSGKALGLNSTPVAFKNGRNDVQLRDDTEHRDTSFEIGQPDAPQSKIAEVLLRHFSEEDLLNSSKYIEAETMPEASFTESVETVLTKSVSVKLHYNLHSYNDMINTEKELCNDVEIEDDEATDQASSGNESNNTNKTNNLNKTNTDDCPGANSSNTVTHTKGSKQCIKHESQGLKDEEYIQSQRTPLGRVWPCNEIKYGQGQVHYPLPDFSKVASKIRIPKGNNNGKPIRHTSGILRTKSSPGLLCKATGSSIPDVDVIRKVLDTIQPQQTAVVFKDSEKRQDDPRQTPELVKHLKDEYDKLLTRYAEAENLIDQMRLGAKAPSFSDSSNASEYESGIMPAAAQIEPFTTASMPSLPALTGGDEDELKAAELSNCTASDTDPQGPSEGEKMTLELKEMISQFIQKVEEFKSCLSSLSLGINEQQEVFKTLMDALDKLERSYMTRKEEHRALELKSYLGKSKDIGEFDPERQVEGQIFRIGMSLEDIKEQIDENVCNQLSSQTSYTTSTPLPSAESISSHTSLHEDYPCELKTLDKKLLPCLCPNEPRMSSVNEDSDFPQGNDPIPEAFQQHSTPLFNLSHCNSYEESDVPPGNLKCALIKDDFNEFAATVEDGILTKSPMGASKKRLSTPGVQQATHKLETSFCRGTVGDLSHSSVNLPIKIHGISNNFQDSLEQGIVAPETDSGLDSLDQSRPTTALSHSQMATERCPLPSNQQSTSINMSSLSSSDSDVSCSNAQTAIIKVSSSKDLNEAMQQAALSAGSTVDHWTHSVISEIGSTGKYESDTYIPHHVINQSSDEHLLLPSPCGCILHDTIEKNWATSEKHSQLCSHHNEAIVALQLEVSRLKKKLEESLFRLPQISKRMDYIDHRFIPEKRYKSKSRSNNKAGCYSGQKHRGCKKGRLYPWNADSLCNGQNRISSDMEPCTDSEDLSQSATAFQSQPLPHTSDRQNCKKNSCPQAAEGYTFLRDKDCTYRKSHQNHLNVLGKSSSSQLFGVWNRKTHLLSMDMQEMKCKEKNFPLYENHLNKSILQVKNGSTCSLPVSLKEVKQSYAPQNRRHSTQSDSALLANKVKEHLKWSETKPQINTQNRNSRKYKDEDMNRTLDKAIEAAQYMKRTTDRMVKTLSADLAKAELHRKMQNLNPRLFKVIHTDS
nr:PREDICTED: protein AKNAD1 isoform X4 [Lepisosteus oculatus]XP_015210998.1 PREDICTED: protein AKNAD1 isoform X4 [Lepisosteus oculatus]XP_015210999.1 PREDICTED: protein AKNAD1 isoform X4 [Lepisosteus oculatus]XP_015211000.1 PREDICTED: protein AKNAD1 isoform X4 [Lepisosteus oculatus]XP_015211001.1 PREDICTED: protein AKNAD1 isoform X4 [Lepisosteus oculatus]